ncbi:MAG TPA: hypothetical protein VFG52_02970 [Xanthomonadales bacterium]|nr:hypothetical protein [Xanthomonadales bacterium]
MANGSFLSELRKRKVVQSAAIYGAVAWGLTEVVVTVVDQLFLPQWLSTLAVIFFVVGFPVAMFLAWTFDITSDGIQRTPISSRRGAASIMAAMALVVAGTTGLFFLIKPSMQLREESRPQAASAPGNSIAVLPFTNAGTSADENFLIQGLSDELRDQLARVNSLRIAARSSSITAAERGLDALSASKTLGVAFLVEGNVRRQGNVLKVSVQLVNGSNGLADLNLSFERGSRELLTVQQAIAEAVVAHVLPDLAEPVAPPATRNATANELMLLARHYEQMARERQDVDEANLLEAIRLYREATEADPESALAHSRLAGALVYSGDLDAADAPIFKALSINPNLSEVQNTLGEFHWARGLVKEAGLAWARAVELNPNDPQALSNYATSLWFNINITGVRGMFERAVSLDPLSLERYATLGSFLALENHPEDARELIARVEDLFDSPAGYLVIGQLWSYLGEVDKSIAWTLRARELEPGNRAHSEKLAEYYAEIGDFTSALKLDPQGIGVLFQARRYQEMLDLAELVMLDRPDDLHLRALMAIAYNALGRFESALNVLRDTGLPDTVFNGWRSGAEWDGYNALMNALYGAGEAELARELARFAIDFGDTVNVDWWVNLSAACESLILGESELAQEYLERAANGYRLPWDPVLKDLPCFDQVSEDPAYKAVVERFDERQAKLRARLPATLAEFGVEP